MSTANCVMGWTGRVLYAILESRRQHERKTTWNSRLLMKLRWKLCVLEDPEYGECYLVEILSSLGVEASESMVEATDVRAREILAQLLETLPTI